MRGNAVPQAGVPVLRTTAGGDMAAFDALPEPLRRCLASAPYELAAESVLAVWRDLDQGPADLRSRIIWVARGIQAALQAPPPI